MDYEPRIVKLEVMVSTLKEELTLLRNIVSALDHKVDEGFKEVRAEQIQLRRDFEKLIYWTAGLTCTNLLAIIGWALKAAGIF